MMHDNKCKNCQCDHCQCYNEKDDVNLLMSPILSTENSGHNAGRPEADTVETTVVCFDKVSPKTVPKIEGAPWCELKRKNLIRDVIISKNDDIYEKIRNVLNLDQGWILYSSKKGKPVEAKDKEGKPIEIKDVSNKFI